MADLDDFFAKKDRKRNKQAKKQAAADEPRRTDEPRREKPERRDDEQPQPATNEVVDIRPHLFRDIRLRHLCPLVAFSMVRRTLRGFRFRFCTPATRRRAWRHAAARHVEIERFRKSVVPKVRARSSELFCGPGALSKFRWNSLVGFCDAASHLFCLALYCSFGTLARLYFLTLSFIRCPIFHIFFVIFSIFTIWKSMYQFSLTKECWSSLIFFLYCF